MTFEPLHISLLVLIVLWLSIMGLDAIGIQFGMQLPIRFSIRDLFWLTLVIALALGWWLDNVSLRKQLKDSHDANVLANAEIEHDKAEINHDREVIHMLQDDLRWPKPAR